MPGSFAKAEISENGELKCSLIHILKKLTGTILRNHLKIYSSCFPLKILMTE